MSMAQQVSISQVVTAEGGASQRGEDGRLAPATRRDTAVPSENPSIYRFGVFEVDLRAGEIRKNGAKLKLQEQPYQVLVKLLERPGQIVSREELRSVLWHQDTFVDFETGLNAAVKRLRETLGDSADNPTFIETLPRRGYKFIAAVELPGGRKHTNAGHITRHKPVIGKKLVMLGVILVGTAALILAALKWRERVSARAEPIRSLAVLPLQNLSGSPDQEYFADGMTEALITELGKISALRVISRQSTMQYKDTKKSAQQIAKELNVQALVEGSVQLANGRVRTTAQLIAVTPERHLWANSYDRQLSDILSLDSEIARAVAKEIKITLTPEDEARLADARVVNPAAHEAYLQGHYFLDRRTKDGIDKALVHFQQAVALDPNDATGYASLSEAYLVLVLYEPDHETELFAKAEAASRKALELDDKVSAAHYTLALQRLRVWDWSGAEAEYRRAIELNPGNAQARMWYADLLIFLGRLNEAQVEIQQAQELDPLSLEAYAAEIAYLYYARRYEEMVQHCQKWVERDANLEWNYHHCRGAAFVQMGRHQEAITELREALKTSAIRDFTATELANALAVAGEREEALKVLAEVQNLRWKIFGSALVETGLGEKDQAFGSLKKAIDLHAPFTTLLKVDPRFDSLRQDARFQDLLRRMNFPK
jgi:TolB-like protein/DNA-binding winged helix-turn-helix (wHTH) protein/Flp pilus assembly protein TadD